jgi:nucleoside-diphosphate-sugar epimerase
LPKPSVAIVGATGLVGAALCERLYFEGEFEPVALVHNVGRAARVARLPLQIRRVDLLDASQVVEIIKGYDFVVNCSRDGRAVMVEGLRNVLRAAKRAEVRGLVHLSSTAIYGDLLSPGVLDESATPRPSNAYAALKLKQDDLVLSSHRNGLPCIILCPTTIFGPYSNFILSLVEGLRAGRPLLVDGGSGPVSLIHVDNLVQSILAALKSDTGWGQRYLVNEAERKTWNQFYSDIGSVLSLNCQLASVSRSQVFQSMAKPVQRHKLTDNLKILLSGEFRQALSVLPVFRRVNEYAYDVFSSMSPQFQARVKRKVGRTILISKHEPASVLNSEMLKVQLRQAYYSPEKMMKELKYRPLLKYEDEIRTVKAWLEFANLL